MRDELSPEDRRQLETMDRLRRMAELHAYSRQLLGLEAMPLRVRLRNRFRGITTQNTQQNPNTTSNSGGRQRIIDRIPRPLDLWTRYIPQQNPMSEEDSVVQEERKKQLLEDAQKRKEKEQAERKKREREKILSRAKDSMGVKI